MNKKKRIATLVLSLIMVVSFVLPAFAFWNQPFNDVPPNHFAFEAINWVSSPANGAFMVGNASRNFEPNRIMNKFEAARIFAMAAGFHPNPASLPANEQAVITRSFDTHRAFLEGLAAEYTNWDATADREIAFLLYRGIVTQAEVQTFVARNGQQLSRPNLTRQEAIAWTVRLMGNGSAAAALTLPQPNPFNDDAQIGNAFRRYAYYARNNDIIQSDAGGNFNPTGSFTRAQMAVVLFNALAPQRDTSATGTPTTIAGTISSVISNSQVVLVSAAGTETLAFAPNVVVMIDAVQSTPASLAQGMTATLLLNSQRQVLSINARTAGTNVQTPPPQTAELTAGEGFVSAITFNPSSITVYSQRINIMGQVVDETRTFNIAPNANITRGGNESNVNYIELGDIAFFGFSGNVIHELDLIQRERTVRGTLIETRVPETILGTPLMVVETDDGNIYELRVNNSTNFSRGSVHNLNWSDMRIGDSVTVDLELDLIINFHAVGIRSNISGRLTEVRITERNSEITIIEGNGTRSTLIVVPGTFDIHTLRIGMQLELALDSREVLSVRIVNDANVGGTVVSGVIQSTQQAAGSNTITVVTGTGTAQRTHTIIVNNQTTITRGTNTLNFNALLVGMNVHIVLTDANSNVAQSITVLP